MKQCFGTKQGHNNCTSRPRRRVQSTRSVQGVNREFLASLGTGWCSLHGKPSLDTAVHMPFDVPPQEHSTPQETTQQADVGADASHPILTLAIAPSRELPAAIANGAAQPVSAKVNAVDREARRTEKGCPGRAGGGTECCQQHSRKCAYGDSAPHFFFRR